MATTNSVTIAPESCCLKRFFIVNRRIIRITAAAGVVLAVALAVYYYGMKGVMPLDQVTLEHLQIENSRITLQLEKEQPENTYIVRAAISMREAIAALGYSPDKSLLYWMSSDFKAELHAGNPAVSIGLIRLTDSILATALGDDATEDDFSQIISHYSSDVALAANQRREPR